MSMILHAVLGVALVALGIYLGSHQHEMLAVLLLFAGLIVMDFFRQRVLTRARLQAGKDKVSGSGDRSDGA